MRFNLLVCFILYGLTVGTALPALAGALPPCVKAVSSKNGKFLVITDMQFEPRNETGALPTLRQTTLQVFRNEEFLNAKDRLTSSAIYWTDWVQWSVVLDSSSSRPVPGCPLSLITDDGEFLVLVGHAAEAGNSALRIYRRRDHPPGPAGDGPDHGVFIRDVPLGEIWPVGTIPKVVTITDETPLWFSGGTFEFSLDSRTLIHTTRWGNTIRINLADGSVTKN